MSNSSMPSMAALLGLLAVAGYKNRDKLSDMLSSAKESLPTPQAGTELNEMFSGEKAGDNLSGGLNDLFNKFNNGGQQEAANSWVGGGQNQQVAPESLERVLGNDTLSQISAQTGLSVQDILARLSDSLPNAVDGFTPDGKLPSAKQARGFR